MGVPNDNAAASRLGLTAGIVRVAVVSTAVLVSLHCAAPSRPGSCKSAVPVDEGGDVSVVPRVFESLGELEDLVYATAMAPDAVDLKQLFPGASLRQLSTELVVTNLESRHQPLRGSQYVAGECRDKTAILGMRGGGSDQNTTGDTEAGDWILRAVKGETGWTVESLTKVPAFDGGVLGQFDGEGCEVAMLSGAPVETSTPSEKSLVGEASCTQSYRAVVLDPHEGTARRIELDSFACPRSWWKCGPTPVCDRGASSGTEWGVHLAAAFPVTGSTRDGLMLSVSEPEGIHFYFYGAQKASRQFFGKRRADRATTRDDKVELLTCGDWRGIRVAGIFDGALVDYNETPRSYLSCTAGF